MVPKPLQVALELLRRSTRAKGGAGKIVREVLRLLEQAERELRQQPALRRASSRSRAAVEYTVERTDQDEVLTERRLSGRSQPFKCPKLIYDAAVTALSESERLMSLDEIAATVEADLGDRPADFQLRVAIRFWMSLGPPLVQRIRARYRPAQPTAFHTNASKAWSRSAG